MSLTVLHYDEPKCVMPEIICDTPLHKKLDKIPLLKLMNKSFVAAIIGKPGSGKSTLVQIFLATHSMFYRVFNSICLFMPKGSRASIKNSVFETLPEDQIFDELTLDTLKKADALSLKNAAEKPAKKTLFIFDDVQDAFKGKGKALESELLRIQSNRRHQRLCILFLCQSYKKLPRLNRLQLSDFFAYNLSKDDMEDVYIELITKSQASWELFMRYYRSLIEQQSRNDEEDKENKKNKNNDKRPFVYFNVDSGRTFINFNEVVVEDQKDKMVFENTQLPNKKSKKRKTEEDDTLQSESSEKKPKKSRLP